jgi:integrase
MAESVLLQPAYEATSVSASTNGNWFREQCDMANLRHCSAHGLRKAAARRLAEAGCTEQEIAAITGHASLQEIVRYTKAADQNRLATAAMDKVETRTGSVKLGQTV